MIKINWGYRVTLLYVGFVGLIAYLMVRSFGEKVDLVTPEYYAEELKYQDRIESIQRNNALENPVAIHLTADAVEIQFPESFKGRGLEGTIQLFRPSDTNLDRTYPIQPDPSNSQQVGAGEITPGLYHVRVEYQLDGLSHYTEKKLIVR
jgi:FixH